MNEFPHISTSHDQSSQNNAQRSHRGSSRRGRSSRSPHRTTGGSSELKSSRRDSSERKTGRSSNRRPTSSKRTSSRSSSRHGGSESNRSPRRSSSGKSSHSKRDRRNCADGASRSGDKDPLSSRSSHSRVGSSRRRSRRRHSKDKPRRHHSADSIGSMDVVSEDEEMHLYSGCNDRGAQQVSLDSSTRTASTLYGSDLRLKRHCTRRPNLLYHLQRVHPCLHQQIRQSVAVGRFAAPATITRTATWLAGVMNGEIVAKALALDFGSRKGGVAAFLYMTTAPTMSMDVVLPPLAKEIKLTSNVCCKWLVLHGISFRSRNGKMSPGATACR